MSNGKLLGIVLILSSFALTAGKVRADAQLVWELQGFSNPEAILVSDDGEFLYVTNTSGAPAEKNGDGYISRVSIDGVMIDEKWAIGLDAPKGLIQVDDRLYVSDIDRLVAIDVTSGKVTGEWQNDGAVYLNGLTFDDQGRVYVSDTLESAIFRLDGDQFTLWIDDEVLDYPNGLRFDGDRILVAGWGKPNEDYTTDVPGHLKAVDIASGEITSVSDGKPIGNLDGIRPDGRGGWLTTDFMGGALVRIGDDGTAEDILDLDPGSADLEFIESERLAVIPMFLDGKVVAYRID